MKHIHWLVGLVLLISSCSVLHVFNRNGNKEEKEGFKAIKVEPYDKIITKEAVSQKGLFNVHVVKDKYYLELHDSILNREILVVTRFIRTPSGAGNYGGEAISEKTIYWEKGPFNKIFLRVLTFVSQANEDEAISKAVNNSSITPILESFDIQARNQSDNASVIEITDFVNSENALLTLNSTQKDAYKLGSLEKNKSFINSIKTYPINVELSSVKTYISKNSDTKDKMLPAALLSGYVTLEINNSFILLPEIPMKKRIYDPRVGYFASSFLEYGDEQQKVNQNIYIHRWRLEPKSEDYLKWQNGELVEPKKPIVYYIDPATPKKWRPYLIAGINDWQIAFEQAGFKNAIVGMEWPEDDKDMSLEDARFSVLRYFASPNKNAYGPNTADPRTGEILESHIGWYHNLMQLLHNWYIIQAGAVDANARKVTFDDELMGTLIRFVSSHEVGHTLGLRHNMGASHATPVAKLRDAEWLIKNGHTSSIMDYARFNYVAQPIDSVPVAGLMPRIGDYDKWAIQWGYGPIPGNKTSIEEKEILNRVVIDSIAANPRLWFGGEGRDYDPRSQAEDLGDNAMLASAYGIENLKRIIPFLSSWTTEKGADDFTNLALVYTGVQKQFSQYLWHVTKNIGGIYATPKTVLEYGDVYEGVPKETQKEALAFLDKHLFNEPTWLLSSTILNQIEAPQAKSFNLITMEAVMRSLLSVPRISRMSFITERYHEENTYTPEEYMEDINRMVWNNFEDLETISSYRRTLQKVHITNLITLYKPKQATGMAGLIASLSGDSSENTDVPSLALSNLLLLHSGMKNAIPKVRSQTTKSHLQYLVNEIQGIIGIQDSRSSILMLEN